MSNSNINSTDLKNILSRFFDKEFGISERMLFISRKFLFDGIKLADIANHQELQNTLVYLKNVMERNNLKALDDLRQYYDRKRTKMNDLFEKLEKVDPEECFAVDFHQACTMYMKPIKEEHKFKSDCLYYLQGSDNCCTVKIQIVEQRTCQINVPYSPSYEEEIFLSQVKGNHLVHQEKKCCASKKSMNAVVSN
jgi:hypothetical protein